GALRWLPRSLGASAGWRGRCPACRMTKTPPTVSIISNARAAPSITDFTTRMSLPARSASKGLPLLALRAGEVISSPAAGGRDVGRLLAVERIGFPAAIQFREAPTIMSPQRCRITIALAIAHEGGETFRPLLVGQKIDQRNALRIERADRTRFWVIAHANQIAHAEQQFIRAPARQIAEVHFDARRRFGKNGHTFIGPARHTLAAEMPREYGMRYLMRQHPQQQIIAIAVQVNGPAEDAARVKLDVGVSAGRVAGRAGRLAVGFAAGIQTNTTFRVPIRAGDAEPFALLGPAGAFGRAQH